MIACHLHSVSDITEKIRNVPLRSWQVLGGKVDQRGSLVNPEKLRFDFTNSGPVKPDQCAKVEEIVRAQISAGYQIYTQVGLSSN